jgi:hypothetical protein
MKNFIKKIMGIDQLEANLAQLQQEAKIRQDEIDRLEKIQEEQAQQDARTPKEIATENKEPWVAVLDTHVNKDNLRNGFFELDWNEYFVLQLKSAGYNGPTDEAIVDAWFSELCRNVGAEQGIDMSRRGTGYVNRALRDDGKTEIS